MSAESQTAIALIPNLLDFPVISASVQSELLAMQQRIQQRIDELIAQNSLTEHQIK